MDPLQKLSFFEKTGYSAALTEDLTPWVLPRIFPVAVAFSETKPK